METKVTNENIELTGNGDKVTEEYIESRISKESYILMGITMTVCNITLDNGYSVLGKSACVDPTNFDEQLGMELARKDAFRQLWPLFGFLLAEKRFNGEVTMAPQDEELVETYVDGPFMPIDMIAKVCHEANRALCIAFGDHSQPLWRDAPNWQQDSAIDGVKFHLRNPHTDVSASHDNWMAYKEADGWVHGEVKDPECRTHPCLVPFEDLPPEQKAKDYLFQAIVHAMK